MAFDLKQYQAKCVTSINQYISKNVENPDSYKLKTTFTETKNYSFNVVVSTKLDTMISTDNIFNEPPHQFRSTTFYDRALLQRSLEEHKKQEAVSENHLEKLQQHILNSKYGVLQSTTKLHQYDLNFYYAEDCAKCWAHGDNMCENCHAMGQTICSACDGRGRTKQYIARTHNTPTIELIQDCGVCHGTLKVPCSQCYGTGKITCHTCQGSKRITEESRIFTIAKTTYKAQFSQNPPQYVEDAIAQIGLINLGSQAEVNLIDQKIDHANSAIETTYSITLNFAFLESLSGNTKINWVLCGQHPLILNSDNAIEKLLSKNLNQLTQQSSFINRSLPFSNFSSKKIVKNFVKTTLSQDILSENNKNHAVSTDYVAKSRGALKKIITSAQAWSLFKWSIVGVIIAVVLNLLMLLTFMRPGIIYHLKHEPTEAVIRFTNSLYSGFLDNAIVSGLLLYGLFYVIFYIRRRWLNNRLKNIDRNLYQWAQANKISARFCKLPAFLLTILTFFIINLVPMYVSPERQVWNIIPYDFFVEHDKILNIIFYPILTFIELGRSLF